MHRRSRAGSGRVGVAGVCLSLIFGLVAPITAARAGVPAAAAAPLPFGPGELCRFAVKFGFVRAGDATLGVEGPLEANGEPAIRFVSTARSSRFFSTFFPVEDRVESIWSTRRRLPLRFGKDIREGKYEKRAAVTFDHDRGVAVYEGGEARELAAGSQDVLSAFYYVRAQPLATGSVIQVPNHAEGKNYPLEVRVLRRETVEVPAGRFACVVVEPLLKSAGLFKQEGSLTIWLTDDARRLPVLMRSKVAVGAITAELESYRAGRSVPTTGPPGGAAGAPGSRRGSR